jgi:hypothetical protein
LLVAIENLNFRQIFQAFFIVRPDGFAAINVKSTVALSEA